MEHEVPLEISSRLSNINHALPFELLGEIFSCISEDPLDLRYATFVCRLWHNMIVHHANLWTNIILGHAFLARFRGARLPHGDAFIRLCLTRSSPLPLHISIHDSNCGSLYRKRPLSAECFSLVKHILKGQPENLFQRCRTLSWYLYKRAVEARLVMRALTSASLPALEYLTIKNLNLSEDDLITRFPRLPQLKEVTLIDHEVKCVPPLFHDDDFAKTERLSFAITSRWIDYDVICVRRFRSIRTLILKETNPDDDEPYRMLNGSLEPAELPLLETLTLSGRVAHQVLKLIRTLILREMEIEASPVEGRHSLVAINLVHMVQSLERLHVSLSEGMHDTCWVEELEQLAAEAPSLVSVCIDPWMAQCLKEKGWCTSLHIYGL